MPQSLPAFAAMRQRPSQSVVLGSSLLPRPVPPIGVPSLKAGCGSDMAETLRFHQMKTNIVCPSSSGTQARACMWLPNSPLGAWRPEREQEVAEAPVGLAGPDLAVAGVLRAPGRFGHVVLRRAVDDRVPDRLVLRQVVEIDVAGVQEAEMRGVDLALERLQIVAVALDEADVDLVFGNVEDLERRQRRRLGARAHVDPHHAGALDHLVGLAFTFCLKPGGGRLGMSRQLPATSNFQP